MQTDANLVFMKDKDFFYHVDSLKVFFLVTLRMQSLGGVIVRGVQKELWFEIN